MEQSSLTQEKEVFLYHVSAISAGLLPECLNFCDASLYQSHQPGTHPMCTGPLLALFHHPLRYRAYVCVGTDTYALHQVSSDVSRNCDKPKVYWRSNDSQKTYPIKEGPQHVLSHHLSFSMLYDTLHPYLYIFKMFLWSLLIQSLRLIWAERSDYGPADLEWGRTPVSDVSLGPLKVLKNSLQKLCGWTSRNEEFP